MSKQSTKRPPEPAPRTRYEDDLYTWVEEQLGLLRSGQLSEIDAANIAEELSDVGSEQRDKLESAIAVLCMHLLKWDHQPERRSRSWQATILEQRDRIRRLLMRNPGLKGSLAESIRHGYSDGRYRAVSETDLPLSTFPESCPYTFEQMTERNIEFET